MVASNDQITYQMKGTLSTNTFEISQANWSNIFQIIVNYLFVRHDSLEPPNFCRTCSQSSDDNSSIGERFLILEPLQKT